MKKQMLMGAATILAFGLAAGNVKAAIDTSQIRVKKVIADSMTPDQLQAWKERLATQEMNRSFAPTTPSDTCVGATAEVGTLPYGPINDTSVGATDNFDLPADTVAPTCTAAGTCAGAPSGAGSIYTGTGTGPDRGWRIQTSANCTLTLNMTSPADMALIVYLSQCSSSLADCLCVDDTGFAGATETVTLTAIAGTTYFALVDGYNGGNAAYTFGVTGSGCTLVPVELESFTID